VEQSGVNVRVKRERGITSSRSWQEEMARATSVVDTFSPAIAPGGQREGGRGSGGRDGGGDGAEETNTHIYIYIYPYLYVYMVCTLPAECVPDAVDEVDVAALILCI
jgi:hypothetical protein